MYTTKPALCASAGNSRTTYARAAVFEEFRRRDATAIDFDGFVDRRANETPRLAPEAWRRETRKQKSWGRVA